MRPAATSGFDLVQRRHGLWRLGRRRRIRCHRQETIGISSLAGSPASPPLVGADVYLGSPYPATAPCAQKPTLGGKPHGLVGLPGAVIYLFHSTQDLCVSHAWLARSGDNGMTWSDFVGSLTWPDANGFSPVAILQYGPAQAGALAPDQTLAQYIYIYAGKNNPGASTWRACRRCRAMQSSRRTTGPTLRAWIRRASDVVPVERKRGARLVGFELRGIRGGRLRSGNRKVYRVQRPWQCLRRQPVRAAGVALRCAESLGPWTTFDYEENFDNAIAAATASAISGLSAGP